MFRPLFAAGLAQQPIAQCPKRAGQRQVTPKSDPGFGAVEAMRQPLDVLMISEAQFVWMPGGAGVEGADQAITEDGSRKDNQTTRPREYGTTERGGTTRQRDYRTTGWGGTTRRRDYGTTRRRDRCGLVVPWSCSLVV